MAVKKKAGKKAKKSTVGRKNVLGDRPRILSVPLRNEDRELVNVAAQELGIEAGRWARRAILEGLERAGLKTSGKY